MQCLEPRLSAYDAFDPAISIAQYVPGIMLIAVELGQSCVHNYESVLPATAARGTDIDTCKAASLLNLDVIIALNSSNTPAVLPMAPDSCPAASLQPGGLHLFDPVSTYKID